MSWTVGRPQDAWGDREVAYFLREIYTRIKADTFTWNPPSVGANATVDTTLTTTDASTIAGLRIGMAVTVTPPSNVDAGILWGAWVAADDQLTIRLRNLTAGAVDMAAGTWAYMGVLP